MIEIILEIVFEVFGEFLLQVVGEALLSIGLHRFGKPMAHPPKPWQAALGYASLGGIVGGLSLLVFPANFLPSWGRELNFLLTPLAVGAIMALVGAWRTRHGKQVLRIDRFTYGYVFAVGVALVRFQFAS